MSFMIKNIAGVDTCIIFNLELEEGKETMLSKHFSQDYKLTTAVMQQLLQSNVSSGRTIHGLFQTYIGIMHVNAYFSFKYDQC